MQTVLYINNCKKKLFVTLQHLSLYNVYTWPVVVETGLDSWYSIGIVEFNVPLDTV